MFRFGAKKNRYFSKLYDHTDVVCAVFSSARNNIPAEKLRAPRVVAAVALYVHNGWAALEENAPRPGRINDAARRRRGYHRGVAYKTAVVRWSRSSFPSTLPRVRRNTVDRRLDMRTNTTPFAVVSPDRPTPCFRSISVFAILA